MEENTISGNFKIRTFFGILENTEHKSSSVNANFGNFPRITPKKTVSQNFSRRENKPKDKEVTVIGNRSKNDKNRCGSL